jgi:hypothetical protein
MTSLVEKRLKSTLGDTAAIKALEDTGTEVSFAKSLKEALGEVQVPLIFLISIDSVSHIPSHKGAALQHPIFQHQQLY